MLKDTVGSPRFLNGFENLKVSAFRFYTVDNHLSLKAFDNEAMGQKQFGYLLGGFQIMH